QRGQPSSIVRFYSPGKTLAAPECNRIGRGRRDGYDWLPGRQDAVHLAWHDYSLQSLLDGDQMRVRCGEDRRNLAGWEKIEEPNIAQIGSSGLEARALGAVAHKNEADAVICQCVRCIEQRVPCSVETEVARVENDKAGVT